MILLMLISIHPLMASVIIKLRSQPALLGQDVTLTCYTQHPLKNSNDCPVRQWTIGDNTAVLVYNSFSYNTTKYADNTNLSLDHFSMIIKHFSFSDVNKKYTCSCGFHSASMFLPLDGYHIVHKPDNSSLNFHIKNDTVFSNLNLRNVFPVPHCSFIMKMQIQDQQMTNNVSSTVEKNGLFNDLSLTFIYNLSDINCNQILHPTVECNFPARYRVQFNGTLNYPCRDNILIGDHNTSNIDVNKQSSNSTATVGDGNIFIIECTVAGGVVVVVVVVVVTVFCLKKRIKRTTFAPDIAYEKASVQINNSKDMRVHLDHPALNSTSSFTLAFRGSD